MAVDFSTLLYSQCQNLYGRNVVITPVASAPGAPAYNARGIYGTRPIEIMTDLGPAIISDQGQTILDIRDVEFFNAGDALPQQGDLITIPAEGAIPAAGDFEVVSTSSNGGGETTLEIRKWEAQVP